MPTVWKIVLSVLVTLIISAGGTYYYMNQRLENEKSDLQNQINALKEQINDLQSAVTTADTTAKDSSATDETADWKTYTNSTYGFSFKYPNVLTNINDQIPTTVAFENSPTKNLEISGKDKTIQVWVNPAGFGLEGAFDFYNGSIIDGKIVVSNKQHNDEGTTFNNKAQVVLGVMEYKNFSYMIAYLYPPSERTSSLAEFDQILSTFRFTK